MRVSGGRVHVTGTNASPFLTLAFTTYVVVSGDHASQALLLELAY